jgi:serine/threonine-protein kinase
LDHASDEALRSLAAAYQKQGKASAAEESYRQALLLRPNYWGVYSAFGTFYSSQGRHTEAAQLFRKAIQLAPLNYRGYSNLGGTYLYLGEYRQAVEQLERSIALRPTFDAYGNLGAAYFYLLHYEDAANTLQKALKMDDKDWGNWGSLGDALYQIPARRGEALSAYRKAIELGNERLKINPRDATILACTADYYALLGQERHSQEQLAKALAVTTSDPDVLFRAAILYNHFRDTEKTLEFLGRAVAAGYSRTVIRDTPDFEHLKVDPRFTALLPRA